MKREKSTEQRLRCPVLFSHAWGEVPPGGREGEVARPLGLSRRGCGGAKSGGGNAKILLPETEAQGLTGSGEQREEAAGRAEGRKPVAGM